MEGSEAKRILDQIKAEMRAARARLMFGGDANPRTPSGGKLAVNIMHFARVLREAGLPVGPGHVLDALDAAQAGSLRVARGFLLDAACRLREAARAQGTLRPGFPCLLEEAEDAGAADAAAVSADHPAGRREGEEGGLPPPGRSDVRQGRDPEPARGEAGRARFRRHLLAFGDRSSALEGLRADDGRRTGATPARPSRGSGSTGSKSGRGASVPPRMASASICGAPSRARSAPAAISSISQRRERQMHEPPLVVLCDISGSCSNYSRMFLHFLHALTNDRDRVIGVPVRHAAHQHHPRAEASRRR